MRDHNVHALFMQAMSSVQSAVVRAGVLDQPLHLITLKPAFVIHNLLPMAFHVTTEKVSKTSCHSRITRFFCVLGFSAAAAAAAAHAPYLSTLITKKR